MARRTRAAEEWQFVEATWRELAIPELLEGPPDPGP